VSALAKMLKLLRRPLMSDASHALKRNMLPSKEGSCARVISSALDNHASASSKRLLYLASRAHGIKTRAIANNGHKVLGCRAYVGRGAATLPLSSAESLRKDQSRSQQQV
jgi:hypothetical protein